MTKTDAVLGVLQRLNHIRPYWPLLRLKTMLTVPESLHIFPLIKLTEASRWLKGFIPLYDAMETARRYIPDAAWETYINEPTIYYQHRDYKECVTAIKACRRYLRNKPILFKKGYQSEVQKRNRKRSKQSVARSTGSRKTD